MDDELCQKNFLDKRRLGVGENGPLCAAGDFRLEGKEETGPSADFTRGGEPLHTKRAGAKSNKRFKRAGRGADRFAFCSNDKGLDGRLTKLF